MLELLKTEFRLIYSTLTFSVLFVYMQSAIAYKAHIITPTQLTFCKAWNQQCLLITNGEGY